MKDNLALLGLIVVALAVTLKSATFIVPEGKQAVITQFGKPIGDTIEKAGLNFKIPFMQEARIIERRILNWDGVPNQFPTKDKKLITVDTTARWKITNPLKLIEKVRDERGAIARLTTILNSATRQIISNFNLVEAVRNSNDILARREEVQKEIEQAKADGKSDVIEEEVTGEIEKIFLGREELSKRIVQRAKGNIEDLGIELIDVQLRRISYHPDVEQKVYRRMISERQRIAKKIKSFGKGEQARIYGKTEQEHLEIKSEAYKKVQEILGKAESERTKIYAQAFNKDPKFYEFSRTLEAYKQSLREDTNFLLSADSEFLEGMKRVP